MFFFFFQASLEKNFSITAGSKFPRHSMWDPHIIYGKYQFFFSKFDRFFNKVFGRYIYFFGECVWKILHGLLLLCGHLKNSKINCTKALFSAFNRDGLS